MLGGEVLIFRKRFLSPNSDKHLISPCGITTRWNIQVKRKNETMPKDKISSFMISTNTVRNIWWIVRRTCMLILGLKGIRCSFFKWNFALLYSIKHAKEGECTGDLPAMGIPMELKGSDELEIIYSYSVRFTVCEISSILDLTGDLGKKREKKLTTWHDLERPISVGSSHFLIDSFQNTSLDVHLVLVQGFPIFQSTTNMFYDSIFMKLFQ